MGVSFCWAGLHDWSTWLPYQAGTQAQARMCARCGKIERDGVETPSKRDRMEEKVSYRLFVGATERYDVMAAMTFNLLTTLGLREGHKVLDIGCGSLRNGRLLIPYLNRGNYTGFDPNPWLVKEALKNETGSDIVRIKKPTFIFSKNPDDVDPALRFDFAFAHAIFCHAPLSLLRAWLKKLSSALGDNGAFAVSFRIGDEDYTGDTWTYPGMIYYKMDTVRGYAEEFGFRFQELDWRHPAQHVWTLYAKPGFDTSWFADQSLTWNRRIDTDASY